MRKEKDFREVKEHMLRHRGQKVWWIHGAKSKATPGGSGVPLNVIH